MASNLINPVASANMVSGHSPHFLTEYTGNQIVNIRHLRLVFNIHVNRALSQILCLLSSSIKKEAKMEQFMGINL